MKVMGFNFNKINAQKEKKFKNGAIATNIEFTNIEKEKIEMLKESEAIRMDFKFSVDYKESKEQKSKLFANIQLEGNILLSVSKEETKTLLDAWKKKQVPDNMKIPLLNLILRKCSLKSITIEEELNLPTHIPIPKLTTSTDKK